MDVERARKAYNSRVEAYLRESGLAVERDVNWAARTETDIMPSPADMKSPGESPGCRLYKRRRRAICTPPLAAEAQGKLDRGDPVSIAEGRAYVEERDEVPDRGHEEGEGLLMKKYTASAEPADRSSFGGDPEDGISPGEVHRQDQQTESGASGNLPVFLPGGIGFSSPGSGESTGSGRGLQERGSSVDASERSSYRAGTQSHASALGEIAAASSSPESRSALKKAAAETLKGIAPPRRDSATHLRRWRHGTAVILPVRWLRR